MNYKLAKELKNAGFPQSDGWIDSGNAFFVDKGELIFKVPTLSALIEACGEDFYQLEKGNNGVWFARDVYNKAFMDETPKEAVANLWLQLNNNK